MLMFFRTIYLKKVSEKNGNNFFQGKSLIRTRTRKGGSFFSVEIIKEALDDGNTAGFDH